MTLRVISLLGCVFCVVLLRVWYRLYPGSKVDGMFWRVLHGTGRKLGTRQSCDSAISGRGLLAGVQVLLFDKDISL